MTERNPNGQSDILNFLDENDGWYSSKDILIFFGNGSIPAINRCLRKLSEYEFITKEVKEFNHGGKEYKYKSKKWK